MRRKVNSIKHSSLKELKDIVVKSLSLADIIRYFNLPLTSSNYRILKKKLKDENIDYSHIKIGSKCNIGRKFYRVAKPLSEVMVKNSTYSRGLLKERLLKNGMLKNKCAICGQLPIYNNQKLVMVLDHKNGINDDHRLENLRLLCPNCNSQQPTFAGKRLKKYHYCKECKKEISKGAKLCMRCSSKKKNKRLRKVKNRPSQEQLLKEIEETNYCVVGRKYGVSDNAIRKWLI